MASRACGNRLSLRNQYDTKFFFSSGFVSTNPEPRARVLFLRAVRPVWHSMIRLAGLNSRHEKIYSVGFEWTPTYEQGLSENVRRKFPRTWEPKKSPGTPESPPDSCCVKQPKSFQTYHLPRYAASRPGGQVPEMHWFSRAGSAALVAVAAVITLS